MSSYIPIASQTLGSATATVTFSSIPTTLNGKTLRDLVLVAVATGTSSSALCSLRYNSDSSSIYSLVQMSGSGSTSGGATGGDNKHDINAVAALLRSSHPMSLVFQVFDFAQTNKHKSSVWRTNEGASGVEAKAGRWGNTAAITSLSLIVGGGDSFAAGSTFALYGIEG